MKELLNGAMRRLIVAMSQKEGVVADTMVEVGGGGGGNDEDATIDGLARDGDRRCTVRAHDRRCDVISRQCTNSTWIVEGDSTWTSTPTAASAGLALHRRRLVIR